MMHRTVLGVALALLSCGSTYAQDAATPAPPACMLNNAPVAADVLAAANDVVMLSGGNERVNSMMALMMPLMVSAERKDMPTISDDALAAFQTALQDEIRKSSPQLLTQIARLYARHYTLDELKQLAAFYNSPVGKKTVSSAADIAKESLPVGMAWGLSIGTTAAQRAKEVVRSKGMKI